MVRTTVKALAENRGMKPTQLQTALMLHLKKQVYAPTIRRYWYSTANGKPDGTPLQQFDGELLEGMAIVLGVPLSALLAIEERPYDS